MHGYQVRLPVFLFYRAPNSNSLLRRLFLLIILRYKSFKSDVAKRPPSNCTIGRKSGGITGITVIIIHSGLFPDSRKDSTTSSLLMILARFWPVASFNSAFSSAASFSRSIACNNSRMASAPIHGKSCHIFLLHPDIPARIIPVLQIIP